MVHSKNSELRLPIFGEEENIVMLNWLKPMHNMLMAFHTAEQYDMKRLA